MPLSEPDRIAREMTRPRVLELWEALQPLQTVAELAPELDIFLWNGLFVHKDTPQEARDKIIAVAEKTVMSERAQKLSADTGALIYWVPADEVEAQISKDIETLDRIGKMLGE